MSFFAAYICTGHLRLIPFDEFLILVSREKSNPTSMPFLWGCEVRNVWSVGDVIRPAEC